MNIPRQVNAFAVAVVLSGLVGSGFASDTASEPLYVIHNGRRVPTMIIPPRSNPEGDRPAVLEVIEPDLPAPFAAEDADDPEDAAGADDPRERAYRPGRRYLVRHYAGYPVSLRHLPPAWGYAYPPPDYGRTLREVYEAERRIAQLERQRRFNIRDMRERKARVLASHEKALRLGLDHLKAANYAQAIIALQMAAELNHGDPACRIHLAQARLAQGHYDEAGQVLRRALQLQPKLAYVSLNLRAHYADPAEFDRHVDALAARLKRNGAGADAWFLLGYMEFQRNNLEPAHTAFRVAGKGLPKDSLVEAYLQITKPPTR